MGKILGQSGVATLWAKVKNYVTEAVNTAKTAVGNYTVNGKKISTNPTLGKGDVGLGNVTNDAQVKRTEMGAANGVATLGADGKLTAGQLPGMKTVNGKSILGSGDITIDLSLYKVVESLPSTDIDANKVYLVLSGTEGTQNIYTEYLYVNNKWEKVGEYKADVDLTEYMKRSDLNNYLTQDNIHVRRQVQDDYGSVQYAGINLNGQKASLECSFDQDGGNEGKAKIDLNGDGTLKIESTPDVGVKTASIYTNFTPGKEYGDIKIESKTADGSNSSIGVGEDVDIYSQGNINIHGGGGSECQINAGNGIFLTSSEVNFSRVSSLTGIKTINGQSILGEGNILEEMTEAELDAILV